MRLYLGGNVPDLTKTWRPAVEHRLQKALARYGRHIGDVSVQIDQPAGTQPDAAKSCRIEVNLKAADAVIAIETDRDLELAIGCAVDRVGQAVGRAIERLHGAARSADPTPRR